MIILKCLTALERYSNRLYDRSEQFVGANWLSLFNSSDMLMATNFRRRMRADTDECHVSSVT